MAFKIHQSGLKPTGNSQHLWLELCTNATLTARTDGNLVPGKVKWQAHPPGILSNELPPEGESTWTISGKGFGQIRVTASSGGHSETLDICVGSVIIAGADGKYWQVFPDGSTRPIESGEVGTDIECLVKNNAIVADLTPNKPSKDVTAPSVTAVTCYLLNLKSFMPKLTPK